jgi:RNA polymerase sigma factor (sigma-70 family)
MTCPVVAIGASVEDTESVSDTIESLARHHHAELLRVLRTRLRSEQDAADLAQEAFTRLLRYESQCTGEDLRRMLFRIASNLLTDHWRWRRLRRPGTHLPIDELDVASSEPGLERQIGGAQRLARLEQIVLAMPEKRRTVFVFSRIHGLAHSEIAQRCGISVKTVEKHIALALAECRARAGEDDPPSL